MRYKLTEGAFILAKFPTGSTVTITLYKLSDSSSVTLTSSSMSEISTTGVYKWNTSNITTQPTSYTEYLWIATDGTLSQYGKIALGGYPDTMSESVWTQLSTTDWGTNTMGEKVKKPISYIVDGEIPL